MKNSIKKTISTAAIFCLLAASLTGCGSEAVTEVAQTDAPSQQEIPQNPQQSDEGMEVPEMAPAQVDIPEEDVQELIQAGLNAVMEESDLWSISEVTDTEVLMQLMMLSDGGRERPDGKSFEGEPPENRTSPAEEFAERPDGEMPDMPQRNGEMPPENMDGAFPEGEMPEGGRNRGEGGGRQPGNRGGGMSGLAIVISGTEDTTLATEDIFEQIQLAAEELGYQASSMELTEEQQSVIEVPDGYSVKMVILINTQMLEMEAGEAVG